MLSDLNDFLHSSLLSGVLFLTSEVTTCVQFVDTACGMTTWVDNIIGLPYWEIVPETLFFLGFESLKTVYGNQVDPNYLLVPSPCENTST